MTNNNEIIIDGVDVSGCEYYTPEETWSCGVDSVVDCHEIPNCLFKQLLRAQAENKELEDKLCKIEASRDAWTKTALHYNQKCEELEKKYIKLLQSISGDVYFPISEPEVIEKIELYKQALSEIKDIAVEYNDPPCLGEYDCENCEDEVTDCGTTCMKRGLDKIIQKVKDTLNQNK